MRLEEFFQKWARGRGVLVADKLATEIRRLLSVQAPVRRTASGKLVATTRATPGAPPRKVSGDLYRSVRVHRTAHGARVVIYKWYSVPLEHRGHPFLSVALANLNLKGRNA